MSAKEETIRGMVGRPSSLPDAIQDEICTRIAHGESLVHILKSDPKFPGYSTVCRHLRESKDQRGGFWEMYARAREDQADYLAQEILTIADDSSLDWVEDKDGRRIVDHEHIQRSKVRIDTRKWIASKLKPRNYGDRVHSELSGPDGGPIPISSSQTQTVNPRDMTDEELDQYLADSALTYASESKFKR